MPPMDSGKIGPRGGKPKRRLSLRPSGPSGNGTLRQRSSAPSPRKPSGGRPETAGNPNVGGFSALAPRHVAATYVPHPARVRRRPMYVAPGRHQGLLRKGNIDVANRPVAHNPDGSISTVRSITVTVDGTRHLLLPTVIHGRVVSNEAAVRHWQQTGEHLGLFTSERAADSYSEMLHRQQARMYLPSPDLLLQALANQSQAGFAPGGMPTQQTDSAIPSAEEMLRRVRHPFG